VFSGNSITLFLMKWVFIFKIKVYPKRIRNEVHTYMSTHFILQISFIKVFSQVLFLFSKIAEIGRIPLWYYSCHWKLWGYFPRFIKVFVDIFVHKPHLAMINFSMQTNQEQYFLYVYVCLSPYQNLSLSFIIRHPSLVSPLSSF
jgi:hypothetical protein